MADTRPRRHRLLALLPRIFAEQPGGSAIGVLIEGMAAVLAELDEGLIRTQRDHWVNLARGDTTNGEVDSALERLGALLDIPRLAWVETVSDATGKAINVTKVEETEAYRQRLILTAGVLTRGLTTPRALLELAIVTLGAEPCPRQEIEKDAILAFGVPLGTRRRCRVCQSNTPAPCPNTEMRVLEAWIIENPPLRRSIVSDPPLKPGGRFKVKSLSLVEDVPELRLKAIDKPVQYPSVQNRDTGEIILYAGEINPGEVLNLWPQIESEEAARYDSHDPVGAHAWRNQYPSGSAVLIGVDGSLQSVSAKIYYLSGPTFPPEDLATDAPRAPRFATPLATEGIRFADALSQGDTFDGSAQFATATADSGARFGSSGQRVRSPRLRSGNDEWMYGIYTKKDIEAIAGRNPGALLDNAPEQPGDTQVELTLSWWVRPPATFRLRIPRNAWVGRAESRNTTSLLAQWVQRAKAAGVLALVDFPEQELRETQFLSERGILRTRQQWQESQMLEETTLRAELQFKNQEIQLLTEGALTWRGVFDTTRLDESGFD